jgi:tripartite-type tricarboxylate transporter receptor subunit TctC
MINHVQKLLRIVFLLPLAFVPVIAAAQAFPDKPIRIIDPWAPGGGSSNQIRPLAQLLSEQMGQQVVVEAKPGANSIIGTHAVAVSAPDGYTLLMGSKTIASNASFYQNLPYDAATALTPITMVSKVPFFIVASGSVQANTLGEFIAQARKKRPASGGRVLRDAGWHLDDSCSVQGRRTSHAGSADRQRAHPVYRPRLCGQTCGGG